MKRIVLLVGAIIFFAPMMQAQLKVLHLTFHNGCKNDFQEVANELNLDLTTWYVQDLPANFWMGRPWNNSMYNINHEQADTLWLRHKDFFNSFDVILTSDTAPLSRIFLQNGWQKPLIIWVCNRFDYFDYPSYDGSFPDKDYYQMITDATTKKNVFFASYTPFERVYGNYRGVDWGDRVIKPLGKMEQDVPSFTGVAVPDKKNTLLLFPRLEQQRVAIALNECKKRGIKVWTGAYNGPEDIKQFKGVLFFPYAYSNLALFENLQRGVVHFVPTIRFLKELNFIRKGMQNSLHWSEWYFEEYRPYIQYFDSWQELAQKVKNVNFAESSRKIKQFGKEHRNQMLLKWKQLFNQLAMS